MVHQGTHDVINGMDDAFGMTILWRSMRTGHANSGTMSVEKATSNGVVKLTTVIALGSLNHGAELSSNIRKKLERVGKVLDLRRKGKVHE